jgi:threonine/homoserine/homoserine lactone efflux protein
MTIVSFVAVFAAFGLVRSPSYPAAGALVTGVFIGSALWWLLLSTGVARLRRRATGAWMQTVNRLSGGLILAFGLFSLWATLAR